MLKESDPIDQSALLTDAFTEALIASHVNRNRPIAEFDAKGNKVCLECGLAIPKQRAVIPDIVTCIKCQTYLEKRRVA